MIHLRLNGRTQARVWQMRFGFALLGVLLGSLVKAEAQTTCDYTVTSFADSGPGTLRAGLADSTVTNICFSGAGTINLASTLQVNYPVTITDSAGVTISGQNKVQIFSVSLYQPGYAKQSPQRRTRPVANASPEVFVGPELRINGMTLTQGNANYGGAIQLTNGQVTLVGTTLTNNTANGGGAIYNEATLNLTDVSFTGNTATTFTGGAIDNEDGYLTIQGGSFTNNASPNGAGAIHNTYFTQITGGFFTGNTGLDGGAIFNDSYYAQLTMSGGLSFTSNVASDAGGAVNNAGTATISQALFKDNYAQSTSDVSACGGAVYNSYTIKISESTFTTNNSTQNGGAIGNGGGGSLTLVNDTIVGNTAALSGSGIDNESEGYPTISNTIIANNAPIDGAASDCSNCSTIQGSNNLIGVNPYLGPLAFNGGATNTMMPLPGGPAVGGGNPSVVTDTQDQRGLSRLSGDGIVDIGAVQSHYSAITFSTQPSNAYLNTNFSPPVAVQVLELDGNTKNYPLGVPVTVSLLTSQGVQASSNLTGTLTQSPTTVGGLTAAVFPDLQVNATGSYEMQATIVAVPTSAEQDPAYGTISSVFQISQPTVVTLQWQPAAITYGPMPASEFNAAATINGEPSTGTFVYTFTSDGSTINVGQIYPVGLYRVQVTYTPTGSSEHYTLGTGLQITQASPTLTWPAPAPIYTSTPLSGKQLDASATGVTGSALPGTFVYAPAAGSTLPAGHPTLSVTFTPSDTANYTNATGQVPIEVDAPTAASVTVQDSANPITFGQSETFTATVTGTDGKPYSGGTAAFTVDGAAIGSATVANGSATVSTSTIPGGAHTIGVTFTDGTNQLTGRTTLLVNKAAPVLTWATPAPIFTSTPLGDAQLDATAVGVGGASLAGTFSYTPAKGATLPAGAQTLSAAFTPSDSTDYTGGTVQTTIQVNAPSVSAVTVQDAANPITYGQSETFTATVTGTDGKPLTGGTAAFTLDGVGIGSVAVSNGVASLTPTALISGGTHEIGLTYTNTSTNQTLTGTTTLTVNKAAPKIVWAAPAAIFTSTPLSATQLDAAVTGVAGAALPGTSVYTPAAGATLPAGTDTLSVSFTPSDTTDYSSATAQVSIQVNMPTASTVVLGESANPITYGQSETLTATVTGSDGKPLSGGVAAFASDGAPLGSANVTNGSASVVASGLKAGTHALTVTYTNTSPSQTLTGSTTLTVNKATPTIVWLAPAAIYTSTPLSATQLDAAVTGVGGAALPGTSVYSPAAGATLPAGTDSLSVSFTPSDTTDYSSATAQVNIQVNAPTASTVVLGASANPITYGQSETLTATVTGSDGKPLSGGVAAFTSDGTSLGSANVTNGTASIVANGLTAGTHALVVTYTSTSPAQQLTSKTTLTVNKAAPKIVWATPAAIFTSTPLSATQLNAAVTGVTGAALPGTSVYSPAAGTTLPAGTDSLSVSFTPSDTTDYSSTTAQVSIQVSVPTASTVALGESANPIIYGQSETLTATVTGSDGKPLSGGVAAFGADGTSLGSANVTNGSASIVANGLSAGTHALTVTYTSTSPTQQLTGTATLMVNKATPVLQWPTPASITAGTALSAAQLDATATGVNNAALTGAFVYSPGAGTVLTVGSQMLSTTFTPTDSKDYNTATAQVTLQVGFVPIQLTAVSPSTLTLSSSAATVQIAGTGFTSTSVVMLGGASLATTVESATSLTAVIPAKSLASPGSLSLTVYDSASKFTSNALTIAVSAQTANASITVPASVTSGEQPGVTIDLASAYPVDLAGSLNLEFTPSGNGVDDPAVQFATGGRSLNFTIASGTLSSPQFALQTGTVAGTITISLVLTANGVDVTPQGVSPITLVIAPSAPVITSVAYSQDTHGLITVVVNGFSNTRDASQADFTFTGSGAHALNKSNVTIQVDSLFSPWYSATDSDQYGSAFTYTQTFQLSSPDPTLTGVSVTLTNSVGTSGSVDSQ